MKRYRGTALNTDEHFKDPANLVLKKEIDDEIPDVIEDFDSEDLTVKDDED